MLRKKRVVGTAGHIDHGKTALVRALTGVDTDRLPEEKKRGITIDLGFASWFTDDYQIGFIDVPGHERFVKNMLAGVGGIDSALLVVAADESIKPQTREHFAICRLLDIKTGVVAITKRDLVEDDIIDLVRLEIEELVAGSFLAGKPIVPVSSVTGAGLDDLRRALLSSVAEVEDRDATTRVFRLPIDRVFTMKGFGSVITGTTYAGRLNIDTDVEVLPGGKRSRARNIQVHSEARDYASAGERTSVNLPDIDLDQLRRGQQLVTPNTLRTSQVITARLDLLPDAKPLKEQTRIRFHHLSAELLGSIRFVDQTAELKPATSAYIQIRLESPVVAVAGDRFVIRRYSPALTVGGGVIVDAHLPKLSRNTRAELLDTLAGGTLHERVALMTKMEGLRGLTMHEVQARTGIRIETLTKELKNVPHLADSGERRWIHHDVLIDFRRKSMEFLRAYFDENRMALNVPKSEFVQKLLPRNADGAMINFLLQDLAREKIVAIAGDALDIPGRSKTLGGAEGELARMIESRFAEAGLAPPPVSELINERTQKARVIEGVIGFLVKQGTLVRLAEGIYVHRDALAAASERIAERRGDMIDVGHFKEYFGLSRKIAIPLLEWMDREGVTKRVGDSRKVL
ncbi:MAG TPA: selenocysteine-specific translation elongation factor [Thermoanaerobaculia bacterium]|jgi:selenocysteine-specific elongation factor|nr:selenocysteine-specific translation elongation factor [Thermoanaerobaculia bacterium]